MLATSSAERVRTVVYEDGLGERFVVADWLTGGVVEVLQVSPALVGPRMFEFTLRERVARLSKFGHPSFLTAHRVDSLKTPSPGLAVVSPHVEGVRLSQLLRSAQEREVRGDIAAALEVVRQLLPPTALLHEFAPDIASGLIAPERLIVSPGGHLTMVDQTLGGAIERLRMDRDRLWRDLRMAVPSGAEPVRFTHHGDILCLGLVALAVALARPLDEQDFPAGLAALLDAGREPWTSSADHAMAAALREWLERALQLDPQRSFRSIGEAWVVFSKILPNQTARALGAPLLDAFVHSCTTVPPRPSTDDATSRAAVSHVQSVPPPPQAEAADTRVRASAPDVPSAPPPPPAVQDAQDPTIHVEMLPPPDAQGDLTSLAVAADDIDWTSASEPLAAVASSHDISALLSEADDARHTSDRATAAPMALFEEIDEAAVEDGEPAAPSSYSDMPPPDVRGLAARLVSLGLSSKLSRTALATGVVTMLAVSVVWASLRAPANRTANQGTLVVQTSPAGLQVLVDGVEHGQSPARVRLSSGDHLLEVRGAGGARVVPVTVASGTETSQYLEFPTGTTKDVQSEPLATTATGSAPPTTPAPVPPSPAATSAPLGKVLPASAPDPGAAGAGAEVPTWGWVAVKGPFPLEIRTKGKTVGAAGADRVRMAVGRHEVELVNESQAYRVSRVVYVAPGKVTNVLAEKPATGTVSVNASPWAEVWIGGRRIGETPLANVVVAAGRHEVVFRHPQFGEKRQEISVTAGAAVRVTMAMQ